LEVLSLRGKATGLGVNRLRDHNALMNVAPATIERPRRVGVDHLGDDQREVLGGLEHSGARARGADEDLCSRRGGEYELVFVCTGECFDRYIVAERGVVGGCLGR
jgi:hypothetical protein